MRVKQDQETKQFVLLTDENEEAGRIEYLIGGDGELYATHTEVYPAFKGNSYAALLLDALADYARFNPVKKDPSPF